MKFKLSKRDLIVMSDQGVGTAYSTVHFASVRVCLRIRLFICCSLSFEDLEISSLINFDFVVRYHVAYYVISGIVDLFQMSLLRQTLERWFYVFPVQLKPVKRCHRVLTR